MICGGSPCQDFSVAGKQKGSYWHCSQCNHEYNPLTVHFSERDKCPMCGCTKLDKTRSSLLVEWLRIVRANKPEWGIYENVKNIVGKHFKATFDMFVSELKEYGYNVYYEVLNAKNYGVPQNRERVYVIIIKKEMDNGKFKFPAPFDNGIRLKDILEDEVDEKYYINNEKAIKLIDELVESDELDGRWTNYRIRKLTPLCCWKLMGFNEEDFIAAKVGSRQLAKELINKFEPQNHLELMQYIEKKDVSNISNTQLYKLAGNSIVTDVLYHIYKELYLAIPYLFDDLTVGSFFSGIGAFETALDRLYSNYVTRKSVDVNFFSTASWDNLTCGEIECVGNLFGTNKEPNPSSGRVYSAIGGGLCEHWVQVME